MKKLIVRSVTAAFAAFALIATANRGFAQETPAKASHIKGSLEIQFYTRTQLGEDKKSRPGVTDLYKLNLNVSNSAIFAGEIQHLPALFSSVLGRETQAAKLDYRLDLSVVNPVNVAQTKRIGRLVGTVPIDRKGVYRYGDGTLMVGVDAAGKAAGFESKFRGLAYGKPPKTGSKLESIKKDAIPLIKQVNGRKVQIVVKDYDTMRFENHVLAAGPVKTYPESVVNGEMLYDYERSAWYFHGVTVTYTMDDKQVSDKLTGNIRWVESPNRSANGEGEYQFDVRVNEPEAKADATAVFVKADDESAFFETDSSISALTGFAKYKDTFSGTGDDVVTRSQVTIDLAGNKLSRQQETYLAKLIFLTAVVPFNTD